MSEKEENEEIPAVTPMELVIAVFIWGVLLTHHNGASTDGRERNREEAVPIGSEASPGNGGDTGTVRPLGSDGVGVAGKGNADARSATDDDPKPQ